MISQEYCLKLDPTAAPLEDWYPNGNLSISMWHHPGPASQLPNQEAHSALSAHGSRAGNPIGVVLLQVRWTMTGHSRAGDHPPECCGQRRRKGRPGRAESSALLLHGDYVRIFGRPTVGGGTPCSGCSLGMLPQGQEVLWLFPPVYWEANGGK